MLLSRVANSLYWMGRYLERAENANRHLLVAGEFAVELEGIDEEIALTEWGSLLSSMALPGSESEWKSREDALDYMASFLVDLDNPFSVFSSLGKARDNARSVGETITFEITTNLNEAHRRLRRVRRSSLTDLGVARDIAAKTHNSILTTLGAIEHTLTRGEGWDYLKLGEAIERTQRTLFVLKMRLPSLAERAEDADSPLYYASWRSLLRSLASLENYRMEYGPRFHTEAVTRFLLFHPSAPRAVNCGVLRMAGYLRRMSEAVPGIRESRRRLGQLAARLEFDQDEILCEGALVEFIDESLALLKEVNELLYQPVRLG